jgi:hypothetical protein
VSAHCNSRRDFASNTWKLVKMDILGSPLPEILQEFIHSSLALQPFLGPCPTFQFRNPIHSQQESFDGGSARRKAASCTGQHKHRHSNPRPQCSSGRRLCCARPHITGITGTELRMGFSEVCEVYIHLNDSINMDDEL